MLKKGIKQLVDEANAVVDTISVTQALELHGNDDILMVDLRDIRELQREGKITGATHAPRGMLEFWVDPESPYHKDIFSSGKKMVLYCAMGWRSALAAKTLHDMGVDNVCHIDGGFKGWREADGSIEQLDKK